MIKLKEFLDTCDFVPYLVIYTLEEEGPVFEGDAHLLYRQDKYKQLLTSSVENWGSADDITDRFAFWITLDVVDFIPFDESYEKDKLSIKESDDKITAKNFQELISKLEDRGYSCEHYYDITRPESNWLYITKNGDPYEAEFYRYSDGEYELYLHNIHPTKRRNESVKRRKQVKENFYRVWYNPYGLERDEEDFMEVTAETEEEARRRVSSSGYVTSVEDIESLTDTYDECLTEDSLDDIVKPVINKSYIWPLYDDSAYEVVEIIEKYQNTNRFKDAIKRFDLKDISYMGRPALQLEIECSDEVYMRIRDNIERERLFIHDDMEESIQESKVGDVEDAKLPKRAKDYLKSMGWDSTNTEGDMYYTMHFSESEDCDIYIDEFGNCYLVVGEYDVKPTDMFYTIVDDYKTDIDDLMKLGDMVASGNDVDKVMELFFG